MRSQALFAAALSMATASAQRYTGFNYGNKKPTGELKVKQDYLDEFQAAKNLVGTNGQFTSAKFYTTVQGDSGSDINDAIFAANETRTSMLLGLWCSAGRGVFDNEKAALTKVLNTFSAKDLDGLIAGIAVGSEDMYRNSDLDDGPNPGANPDVIAGYVKEIKELVSNSPNFKDTPVGHVDTWNVWINASNWAGVNDVIDASDFVGMNAFPYYQAKDDNSPEKLPSLFQRALDQTIENSRGREVWVCESGFPYYGPTINNAVPSPENAERYYHDVGCGKLFGKRNTWWYILLDGVDPPPADPKSPAFGVLAPPLKSGGTVKTQPIYNLDCAATGSTGGAPDFPLASANPSTLVTLPSSSAPATTPSASGGSCPADLNGSFEFPHLIVPVSSAQPDSSLGTQYSGTFDSATSTLFNFDVNPSLAGKTCSVVFLLPRPDQLVYSSYDFNNQGGLSVGQLSVPASQDTSFSNAPSSSGVGAVGSVTPGNGYVVSSGPCPAGQTIGYRVEATGGLSLNYFQDYNPAGPVGLFLRAC